MAAVRAPRERAWRWMVLGSAALASASAWADFAYSPKISFRMANGYLQNLGTFQGSVLDMAGLNVLASYFFNQRFSVGVGYRASFDFKNSAVPVSGFQFPVRYYFSGLGTQTRRESGELAVEGRTPWGFYAGAQLGIFTYYLGGALTSTASMATLNGSFQSVDGLAGVDYRLSRHFELNAEASYGLFSFAASDSRYKLRAILVLLGISYVW